MSKKRLGSPQKHGIAICEACAIPASFLRGIGGSAAENVSATGSNSHLQAQFHSMHHHQSEEIYSFVEAWQHLDDLRSPFMDHNAKEELVIDQFLNGIGSHESNVQAAANEYPCNRDVLHVAQSVQAVHEGKRYHSW